MKINSTLFADFVLERENARIIENEVGFLIYKIGGKECYICNMFVSSDHRGLGVAHHLIDKLTEVAKGSDCKILTGDIYLNDEGAETTVLAALKIGFKLQKAEHGVIRISKLI